mmetsp:Transcript_20937/g.29552  ORF Transcript_20937/g.29552 Transcript_20937/m.29552 type:complete len:139 (+) Transcript_20937:93-509(+)
MGVCEKLRFGPCKKEEEEEIDPDEVTVHGESNGPQGIYRLKRVRFSHSSGMLWRRNPGKKTRMLADQNWPRDGAMIDGQPELHNDGQEWLYAYRVQQPDGPWEEAPEGAYLPMKYDNCYELEYVKMSDVPRIVVRQFE